MLGPPQLYIPIFIAITNVVIGRDGLGSVCCRFHGGSESSMRRWYVGRRSVPRPERVISALGRVESAFASKICEAVDGLICGFGCLAFRPRLRFRCRTSGNSGIHVPTSIGRRGRPGQILQGMGASPAAVTFVFRVIFVPWVGLATVFSRRTAMNSQADNAMHSASFATGALSSVGDIVKPHGGT